MHTTVYVGARRRWPFLKDASPWPCSGLLCRMEGVLHNSFTGCGKPLSRKNLGLPPFSQAPHRSGWGPGPQRANSAGTNSRTFQSLLSAAESLGEKGGKGYMTEMSQSIRGEDGHTTPRQAGRIWWPKSFRVYPGMSPCLWKITRKLSEESKRSPKVKHTFAEWLMNCFQSWGLQPRAPHSAGCMQ